MSYQQYLALMPASLRRGVRTAADLVAVVALVALVNVVVFLPSVESALLRVALGTVFVLFVPGYVLLAVLFPDAGGSPGGADADGWLSLFDKPRPPRSIDGLERAALSFGLSIALVPLLMLGLTLSRFPFALAPIVFLLSGWTLLLAPVALLRRWQLPPRQRFRVPYWRWAAAGKQAVTGPDERVETVLNVAVVAAVLLALATSAVAIAVPPDGEQYTEFYVSAGEGGGNVSFSDYPSSLTAGEPEPVRLGIENYEEEPVDYAVAVQLQRVAGTGDDAVVTDRAAVDRFSARVGHNETRTLDRRLTAPDRLVGEDRRMTFFLYRGSVPDDPTAETAYRTVYFWVDVDPPTNEGPGATVVTPDGNGTRATGGATTS